MAPRAGIFEPITRGFKPHAWLYGAAMVLGIVTAALLSAPWLFWPLMIWTLLFLAHFLLAKSLEVTNDWVDERTEHTVMRAHDLSHIESIREHYEDNLARGAAREPKAPEASTADEESKTRS